MQTFVIFIAAVVLASVIAAVATLWGDVKRLKTRMRWTEMRMRYRRRLVLLFASVLALTSSSSSIAQSFDYRTVGTNTTTIFNFRPYIGSPPGSEPPVSLPGWGKIYLNGTTGLFRISQNGSPWSDLYRATGTDVLSFNARIGDITPAQSDYDAFFLTTAEADARYDARYAMLGSVVTSTFGRTGAVVAAQADYDAFFTTPGEAAAAAPVQTVFGRAGAVLPAQADYDDFFLTSTEGDSLFLTSAEGDALFLTPAEGDASFTTPLEAAAAAPIQSIFGRTGIVTAAQADYDSFFINTTEIAAYAPLASPVFTGNPTAPTPATADNDTSIATTAMVTAKFATGVTGFNSRTGAVTPAQADYDSFFLTPTEGSTAFADIAGDTFTGTVAAPTFTSGGAPQTLFGVPGTSTPRVLSLVDGTTGTPVTSSSATVSVQRVDATNALASETVIPYFFSTNRTGTGTTGALYNLTGYIDSTSALAGAASHDIVGTAGVSAALPTAQRARAWGGFFFGQNACTQSSTNGCIAEGIEVNVLNSTGGTVNYSGTGYGSTIGIDLVGLAAGTGSKYNNTALAINAGLPASGAVSARWITGFAIGQDALADETYAYGIDLRKVPVVNANALVLPPSGWIRWPTTGDAAGGNWKAIGSDASNNLIIDTPVANATVPTPGAFVAKSGGTTTISANQSGVDLPTQPRARVYAVTSVPTPATGTWTTVSMDTENYDVGDLHSTVTNPSRVTVTTAGVYSFTARAAFTSNATGVRAVRIQLNGVTTIGQTKVQAANGEGTIIEVNDQYLLAANDYVELQVYQTSTIGLAIVGGAALTSLSVGREY